ncbi:DUF4175 family protein [Adhaeribacter aquaticus]|uniref:DUF4175 family protein n=1 Tax=Adhaeribacter aquaticus TaxID=299567 RepID=UPI00047E99CE|nr:DUF4175 family protein [Adhaeribacter aquaticus]
MRQNSAMEAVLHQLQEFKKRFYLNLLVKGLIFSLGLLLSFFLIYTLLEYFFYFPYYVRAFLFFSFIGICLYAFLRWIFTPLTAFANLKKLLTDEQAAQRVGNYYPEIKDKLLNTIQLQGIGLNNELITASIEQKSAQFSGFHFADSIRLGENKPLLKYVLVPMAVMLGIALIYPSLFVQGTERIIHYKKYYAPEAPFTFHVQNKNLQAFQHEDFTLKVELEGKTIPKEVTILYNGREQKLVQDKNGSYSFTFQKLQKPVQFQLAGGGFYSEEYNLNIIARPNLIDFFVDITYPTYLHKATETIRNTGNLSVPEGSTVKWNFETDATEQLSLDFKSPDQTLSASSDNNLFKVSKRIDKSQEYAVKLRNKYSFNKDEMNFMISSIPDRSPDISMENFQDTATFSYLVLGGNINDDYGLTRLNLHYRIANDKAGRSGDYKTIPLRFDPQQLSQTYYYQWDLDNLKLAPGDRLEYFVQVWDNDGVHGSKSARTHLFDFQIPTRRDIENEITANAKSMQGQLSKTAQKSQQIRQEIEKAEEKLKTKKELSWQDKKQIEDLMEKKKQLESDIQSMKQMFEQLNKQQERFNEKSPELAEKAKQLQELMNQLLDEETKKLYQELEKLLQQNQPNERELQKLMDKLDNKEKNLEKELERALELFKQLQLENKLENTTNKLDELAKEQEKLAEKTENKQANDQQLQQEQKDLKEKFEDLKKDMQEMKELDKQLNDQYQMDDTKEQEKQIDKEMQDSQESLDKGQNKKASKSQKNASEQMKQMAQKMKQKMESSEQEEAQQNLDNLRDILENLITLSFDQEELMKSFRGVSQSDPRFIQLGQQQLKLKDDAKIIEDSLNALAKKVFQIQSFVTREVSSMNDNIANSLQQIKERNVGKATGYQQLTMTSINNLALMLNDALKQMQQQMQQMAKSKPGSGKKKKGNKPQPGEMGQMQQSLNEKMEQLRKGNQQGKGLSEELAKLAAEQQMLRNALKELEKQGGKENQGQGLGNKLNDLGKMMEQTETDLVNKRLTEQTIMRQREILTRLLEAEKSARERELDNKRESRTASEKTRIMPPSLEKYLKTKEKQTELLKTVTPAFSPYYKQEVNEYFQRITR